MQKIKSLCAFINTAFIMLAISLSLLSCHKDGSGKNAHNQRCNMTQWTQSNIGQPVMSIVDYVYSSSHDLIKKEAYLPGDHANRSVVQLSVNETDHTYRQDNYLYKADTIYRHFSYTINYFNEFNKLSSSEGYICVQCSVPQPAIYKLDIRTIFQYDAQRRLVRSTQYNYNGQLLRYTVSEYDGKGRLSKETYFKSNGDLDGYTVYKYAAADADNYSLNGQDITVTSLYGDAMKIQPTTRIEYDASGTILATITFQVTGDANGNVKSFIASNGITQSVNNNYEYDCY